MRTRGIRIHIFKKTGGVSKVVFVRNTTPHTQKRYVDPSNSSVLRLRSYLNKNKHRYKQTLVDCERLYPLCFVIDYKVVR